jgi:hypothetical protein
MASKNAREREIEPCLGHTHASVFTIADRRVCPGIEFGRSRTGEGSSGGRKRGVV